MHALEGLLNMANPIPPEAFKPLELTHREVQDANLPKYRVFTDDTHFIVVEANNAQLALEKSGVSQAHRIEYDSILSKIII